MIVTVTRGTEESYRAPGFRRTRAASRRGKRLVPGLRLDAAEKLLEDSSFFN
jgi:hypothetical protein